LSTTVSIGFTIIGLSLGIAITRHRLFDIDVIIRRTLIYSVLTTSLILVYLGSVIILQQILEVFIPQSQSPLVIVISTLIIAALFNPLRHRLQALIDRRFYRQKYNAEQALAQFAMTARDETDLDKLSMKLVEVVQETIQPAQVSMWLRSPHKTKEGQ
jgi:hypothetical protein